MGAGSVTFTGAGAAQDTGKLRIRPIQAATTLGMGKDDGRIGFWETSFLRFQLPAFKCKPHWPLVILELIQKFV